MARKSGTSWACCIVAHLLLSCSLVTEKEAEVTQLFKAIHVEPFK